MVLQQGGLPVDADLEIDVSRAVALEVLHRARAGVDVDAAPAPFMEQLRVGEPEGMVGPNVDVNAVAHTVEEA